MFKYKLKEIHVPFLCTLTLQPVFNCPHSCAWRGTTNCCTSWRSLMARWCRCDWVLPLWQPPPSPLRPQGPANCQRWVAEQQPVSAWLGLMFGTCACLIWLIDDCLYSAVLRSRADSLRSHVILCEWQAFYIVGFFFYHPPKCCTYTYSTGMASATWNCCHLGTSCVYTIQPYTMSLHAKLHT